MGKITTQTIYFYEGETEKNLLHALISKKYISHGKLKKFNLWEKDIKKLFRTFQATDKLLFIIDTDTMSPKDTFVKNIHLLKKYHFHLIIQNKNLEDELRTSCNKSSYTRLFRDFYQIPNKSEFKSRFAQDKSLQKTLSNQDFDFNKLWTNINDFNDFCESNSIQPPVWSP